jgi:uncharacterized protein
VLFLSIRVQRDTMGCMSNTQDNSLVAKLSADLLQARKDGNVQKREVLQSVLTRITNAQAVAVDNNAPATMGAGVGSTEAERRMLTEDDVRALIKQEKDEIDQAIEGMGAHSSHPYAAELRDKAAILSQYL